MRVFLSFLLLLGTGGEAGSPKTTLRTHTTRHTTRSTRTMRPNRNTKLTVRALGSWVLLLALHCSLEICGLGLRLELEERLGMSLSQ